MRKLVFLLAVLSAPLRAITVEELKEKYPKLYILEEDGEVVTVSTILADDPISIERDDFLEIADFRSLRELNLAKTNLDNDTFRYFADLDELESLDIAKTDVDDYATLKELKRLKKLVPNDNLDDAQFANLFALFRLQTLDLSECEGLTAEGLTGLGKLTDLKEVNLPSAADDSTIEVLANAKNLETIHAPKSKATGEGFKAFDDDSPLNMIHLQNSPLSVDGMKALARLKSLGPRPSVSYSRSRPRPRSSDGS